MTGHDDTQSGFTLIETLVAFVILSGTIIMALSAMTDGLHRMQRSAEIIRASQVAQSVLDSVIAASGSDVATTGEKDGFKWQVSMLSTQSTEDAITRPVFIRIVISDAMGHAIPQANLETIVMVHAKP
jgi:prepilin-type N-terminal cleavage/methylation domain-containing protein